MMYAFSDGYQDQFGGPKNKKYMIRQLKDLLTRINSFTMDEQKMILENTIDDWMADSEQIDDILVMGIRM